MIASLSHLVGLFIRTNAGKAEQLAVRPVVGVEDIDNSDETVRLIVGLFAV